MCAMGVCVCRVSVSGIRRVCVHFQHTASVAVVNLESFRPGLSKNFSLPLPAGHVAMDFAGNLQLLFFKGLCIQGGP